MAVWIASVLIVGIWVLKGPTPADYVVIGPGPTPDASKLIKADTATYASQGSFHITTASVSFPDSLRIEDVIKAAWLRDLDLVPEELVYPPQLSKKESKTLHAQQMTESQESAVLAALQQRGIVLATDGALITKVVKGVPASAHLEPGDVIVAVDGKPITTRDQLTPFVVTRPVGAPIRLSIRRGAANKEVVVQTIESTQNKGKAAIGIEVKTNVLPLPFKVTIDANDIGGPSAGLIFALAIYDLLDPADLTGGRVIAGTGTITPDGVVGAVGAVAQKIKGAEKQGATVFLVPADEFKEAVAAVDNDMQVIGVSTLREAIDALRRRSD
ncbi:MAG: PDZ domain-containing protein [Actinomycetota bacterium]